MPLSQCRDEPAAVSATPPAELDRVWLQQLSDPRPGGAAPAPVQLALPVGVSAWGGASDDGQQLMALSAQMGKSTGEVVGERENERKRERERERERERDRERGRNECKYVSPFCLRHVERWSKPSSASALTSGQCITAHSTRWAWHASSSSYTHRHRHRHTRS